MNLTLNSFREMVGVSNYGAVRLSDNGGLEKINNHLLQRFFRYDRTAVSKEENCCIRQAFLASLAGEVDGETFREIREMLGIGTKMGAISDTDLRYTPLKRKQIKQVLDLVDSKRLEMTNGSETSATAELIGFKGAKGLASLIGLYNEREGVEPISVKPGELKKIFLVHGRELQVIAAAAEKKRQDSVGQVAETIRGYLSAGRLEGEKAATHKKVARSNRFDAAVSALSGANWSAVGSLGLKQGVFLALEKNKPVRLGKDDFTKVSLVTLYDKNKEEILAEMAKFGKKPISSPKCDRLFDLLLENIQGQVATNVTRNPISVKVGAAEEQTFTEDGDTKVSVVEENRKVLREIGERVRSLSPEMSVDQFISAMKVMNQTVYTMPKALGLSMIGIEKLAKIEMDGEDVKVTMTWAKRDAEAPSAEMKLTVDSRGMTQITSLVIG